MVIAVLLLFSLLNFLQSMAAGPFGQSGHLVTCHVGEVCRRDHGPAPTQRRWMVELSARACLCRRYHATPRVQVSCVHTHTHTMQHNTVVKRCQTVHILWVESAMHGKDYDKTLFYFGETIANRPHNKYVKTALMHWLAHLHFHTGHKSCFYFALKLI